MLGLFLTAALVAAPAPKPADNTKCPTCGGAVSAKSPKAKVKGREYYVCCSGCGDQLVQNPEKYLNPDGMPKKK